MNCGFQYSLKTYENELDEVHIRRECTDFKQNAYARATNWLLRY